MTDEQDIVFRLQKRAEIRRQIKTRKSVQENKPDRISDLLEEAAETIKSLRAIVNLGETSEPKLSLSDWTPVSKNFWQVVLSSIEDKLPDPSASSQGTHCYNCVYRVGDNLYNLLYEYGSDYPIDITTKKALPRKLYKHV